MMTNTKGSSALMLKSEAWKTNNGDLLTDIVYSGKMGRKKGQFFIAMEFEDREQAIADYKFKFTKREADIIDGVIQGKNNTQLASSLNVSENTVKTHIHNIYRKVGASNRTELTYILMSNQ